MTTTSQSNLTYDQKEVKVNDIVYQIQDNPDFSVRLVELKIVAVSNNILTVVEILDGRPSKPRNVSINNVHTNAIELLYVAREQNIKALEEVIPKRIAYFNQMISVLQSPTSVAENEEI